MEMKKKIDRIEQWQLEYDNESENRRKNVDYSSVHRPFLLTKSKVETIKKCTK